ncbi:MAG: hypothetical protein M3539_13775 [Acidobacteriota bacterium]|nr:hypothetical protein [Acidobacteriota bacterium]
MHKKTLLKTIALILFMTAIVLLASVVPKQKTFVTSAQDQGSELALPVANYEAAEPADPQEKSRRHARSKRFNHQSGEVIKEAPYPLERIWSSHWAREVPAIPIAQSDVILIGTVLDSQAYLSTDKTGVYSEFAISVGEVLKGSAVNNAVISAQRSGGAVRFPSGVIQKYRSEGQGMPRIARKYLLFLKKLDQDDAFSLLTGYELRGEKIVPLDGGNKGGTESLPFDSYRGANVASFLRLVQDSIIH